MLHSFSRLVVVHFCSYYCIFCDGDFNANIMIEVSNCFCLQWKCKNTIISRQSIYPFAGIDGEGGNWPYIQDCGGGSFEGIDKEEGGGNGCIFTIVSIKAIMCISSTFVNNCTIYVAQHLVSIHIQTIYRQYLYLHFTRDSVTVWYVLIVYNA